MSVKQQQRVGADLPRTTEMYRLSIHAMQRFKDHKRLVHGEIIRDAIENGDVQEGGKRGTAEFVIEWCSITYTVVVDLQPGSSGIHEIVTVFHNLTS